MTIQIKVQDMEELNSHIIQITNHKINKLYNKNSNLNIYYKYKKMLLEHKLIVKYLKINKSKTKCNVFFYAIQYKTHK